MPEATLVTGGSNGIGRAIVRRLADEGHMVVNVDIAEPPADSPGHFRRIDLSDKANARAALAKLATEFALTRVVNNAGIVRARPVEQVTAEDFDDVVAVNLGGAILATQAALPAMRAARFGRIVNISSRAVQGRPNRTVYSMTKGGLLAMTRTWALEFAADGITSNAIGPGPVDTETFRHNNSPAIVANVLAAIPMKRLAVAEDVAQSVSFFLDARSGFITGQMLHVCGGQTLGLQPAA
jgi:NAD(P)-dependent dehydrogenase (short-subunit alcohol dehydrogenase family)